MVTTLITGLQALQEIFSLALATGNLVSYKFKPAF
jgi:hypothetical protein